MLLSNFCNDRLISYCELHSTIPPFQHCIIPPFHHSTIPLFHHSSVPFTIPLNLDTPTIAIHDLLLCTQLVAFVGLLLHKSVFSCPSVQIKCSCTFSYLKYTTSTDQYDGHTKWYEHFCAACIRPSLYNYNTCVVIPS